MANAITYDSDCSVMSDDDADMRHQQLPPAPPQIPPNRCRCCPHWCLITQPANVAHMAMRHINFRRLTIKFNCNLIHDTPSEMITYFFHISHLLFIALHPKLFQCEWPKDGPNTNTSFILSSGSNKCQVSNCQFFGLFCIRASDI